MSAVLVVRPSSLGDIVYALAVAADIARALPGTAVDWVAEEAFVELPALSPFVRRTIPLGLRRWRSEWARARTWREIGAFRRALQRERYTVILDLQEQVKGALVALAARGERHGFDRSTIREPAATWLHQVHHPVSPDQHFLRRCRLLAAAALGYALEEPARWSLRPPAVGGVAATPASRYAVALHATSRVSKLWPEASWRALFERLVGSGLGVLVPWGNAEERSRSDRLAEGCAGVVVPPRRTLTEVASLLGGAALVVGVDTGLTHLAAVLGTPTVALFTETDPALAGVAIVGPHARDLGGNGEVPSYEDAHAVATELLNRHLLP